MPCPVGDLPADTEIIGKPGKPERGQPPPRRMAQPCGAALGVEAYRFRRHLYYVIYAIPVSTPSSYSEGVRYPSPFCIL